jgi:hypothetical protein
VVSLCGNDFYGAAQEYFAVYVLKLCTGVWKVVADVAHVGSAKQGITDSMDKHVGIAVAKESFCVL